MTSRSLTLIILLLSMTFTSCQGKAGKSAIHKTVKDSTSKYIGTQPAPEFPKNVQWLNTTHPLTLKQLRGKVVLLDFWTYGCINCYHVIPDLKKLEKDFPESLVIIGVHSAKFQASKETSNIRNAILRFGLEHPVVNDRNFKIWDSYGIRAWPSFVLIDPTGKIVGETSGEGIYHMMHQYISGIIRVFSKEGKINRKPLDIKTVSEESAQSILYFPDKVLADGAHNRLFISDTDHNRVVVTTLKGEVEYVIGSGQPGFRDGSYSQAEFKSPHGLTLIGDKLYVADTQNHAIRVVDLDNKTVATLAGDGHQAQQFNKPGFGKKVELNSPWGLTSTGGQLYVAMAGPHQIWKIDPKTGFAEPFAGTGGEGLANGTRNSVPMAQPSGITTNGKYLYVAEPEASAVQRIGLGKDNSVKTIVGKGLFVFGDKDGRGNNALLQHVSGIALWNGKLLVADTYNNKIKLINPKTRDSKTFLGTGQAGYKDGPGKTAEFNEPGGVSVTGNWLYVADTDNHLIRRVNLKTREVETLQLKGLDKLAIASEKDDESPRNVVTLGSETVREGAAELNLNIRLPGEYHFNTLAPSRILIKMEHPGDKIDGKASVILDKISSPLKVRLNIGSNQPHTILVDVYAYYCKNGQNALCRYQAVRYRIPLEVQPGGKSTIEVSPELKIMKL